MGNRIVLVQLLLESRVKSHNYLIDQVNATSDCKASSGCTGRLKLVWVRLAGLVGVLGMTYSCYECTKHVVMLPSSVEHETTKQTVVGLTL